MRSRTLHLSFHGSNIRILAASGLALALGSLACSGKLAVLDKRAPGEPGSDPDSMSGAPGSTVTGGTGSANEGDEGTAPVLASSTPVDPSLQKCAGLVVQGSFPNPYPQAPVECGYCTCESGETACTKRACPALEMLSRCPSGSEAMPLAPTWNARIHGQTLLLDAQGVGGCTDAALIPCYVPAVESTVASQSVYPRQATIRVLNPAPATLCNKVVFQSFQLDLLPALEEFRAPEGNLVQTTYGMVGIGMLTCAEAATLAGDQFENELVRMNAERSTRINCDSDADCVWTGAISSCTGGCFSAVSNRTSAGQLRSELTRIENATCAPFGETCSALQADAGAMSLNPPQPCTPAPVVCQTHECVQVN